MSLCPPLSRHAPSCFSPSLGFPGIFCWGSATFPALNHQEAETSQRVSARALLKSEVPFLAPFSGSWQIWGSGAAVTLLFQWHCTSSLSSIRKTKKYFLLGEQISGIPVLWWFFSSFTSYNYCLALSSKLSFVCLLPDVNSRRLFCILFFIVISLSADMNHCSSVDDEILLICPNVHEIFLPVHCLIVSKLCPWNQRWAFISWTP